MARDLECSPSFLSRVLREEVPVSEKQIQKMGILIGLDSKDLETTLKLARRKKRLKKYEVFQPIDEKLFSHLTSSNIFVIMELFNLDKFNVSVSSVAKYLGVTKDNAKRYLDSLLYIGMISEDGGSYVPVTESNFTKHFDESDENLLSIQKEFLVNALEALSVFPYEERSQNTLTFSCRRENLDQIKKIIYKCIREVNELSFGSGKNCDEVYNLTLSLVPTNKSRTKQ